ncbi:small-subunit processome [Terfezia claveryi]|nr:small-subunit processome [Terfezia claveryi]
MSSMRNAVQRRNHKERAQPLERSKWGLLEKKKDYKLRSKDYNAKKARLKALQEKANARNPDEFYYSMTNSQRTSKGIHIVDRGNRALDNDTVKLLKTQDVGYLRVKSAIEKKAIERLEVEAALLNLDGVSTSGKKRKHTVFVESREEAKEFDPVKHFDTVPELVNRAGNRLRKEQLAEIELKKQVPGENQQVNGKQKRLHKLQERKRRAKAREGKLNELVQRMKRSEELEKAERELVLQRERFGKGVGLGKPGKFSKERKK